MWNLNQKEIRNKEKEENAEYINALDLSKFSNPEHYKCYQSPPHMS
jgi:hypothetical protein